MIELNDLAFQNADILIAIDEAPNGQWTKKDLALHVGRDDSNLNKTLKRLVEAGLLQENPLAGLTETGAEQLEAIRRAQDPTRGKAKRVRGRAAFAAFRPNPANRPVTDGAVRALADTIEAVGDVLQAIETTRADATGVRMILDGEHRWRAAQLLQSEDRLPPALADGLKFEEREATAAEQILIRIVTATARADLSPLDDARQLLALQKETGWSAREIAKKTGRSPADSDTGVRDVQVKIKVAREASEFFLKQYELDSSWDRLRDSVTQPKPATEREPAAEPELFASEPPAEARPQQAPEDRIEKVWNTDQITLAQERGWSPPTEDDASAWTVHDVHRTPFGFADGDVAPLLSIWIMTDGSDHYRIDWSASLGGDVEQQTGAERLANPALALSRAIEGIRRQHAKALPQPAIEWLDQLEGPHVVNGVNYYNAPRASEARIRMGWDKSRANHGGGSGEVQLKPSTEKLLAGFKATPAPDPQPRAGGTEDLADRTARAAVAEEAGGRLVLKAALDELIESVESHLAGIRKDLERQGVDMGEFEEDTAALREKVAHADAVIIALGLEEGEGEHPTSPGSRGPELRKAADGTARRPAVAIRQSITAEEIVCLEDGRRFKGGLRRYLRTRFNLSPEEYRAKWALPADYPMIAPNHAKRQHDLLRSVAS